MTYSGIVSPEVYSFPLHGGPDGHETPQRPEVLWFAPASLHTKQVASAWAERGDLADLRGVSGPWAAVLWQPRTHAYYVVTDPLGIQPVFWTVGDDGRCYVSAWLDQLLSQSSVNPEVDYEAVLLDAGDHLVVDRLAHRTRFVGVSRVLWGRAVEFDRHNEVRTVQYWDRSELPEPDESMSLDDSAELFTELIDQAIHRVIDEGQCFGAHVSGGLDCTTVAVRANQLLNRAGDQIRFGYSWTPPEEAHPLVPNDERLLLDLVSDREGFPIRRMIDDGRGDWFWSRDVNRYPQSTHVVERLVLPTARDDGVDVLLSGWGGDEFSSFNGRKVLSTLLQQRRYGDAVHEARLRVNRQASKRGTATVYTAKMLGSALAPTLSDFVGHPRRRLSQRRASRRIDRELRSTWPEVAQSRQEAIERFRQVSNYRDYQWFLLSNGHLQHRTTWWYQTGRLFNIQYRFPLLDLDVVKGAFRVPWHAYLGQGWTRVAFRKAVQGWVPAEVAWNPTKSEPAQVSGLQTLVNRNGRIVTAHLDDPKLAEVLLLSQRTYLKSVSR